MENNQCSMVLFHIIDNGSITTWEAFTEYGITRLASRICDLKKSGYDIDHKIETAKNRYGKPVSFCRYFLKEGEK